MAAKDSGDPATRIKWYADVSLIAIANNPFRTRVDPIPYMGIRQNLFRLCQLCEECKRAPDQIRETRRLVTDWAGVRLTELMYCFQGLVDTLLLVQLELSESLRSLLSELIGDTLDQLLTLARKDAQAETRIEVYRFLVTWLRASLTVNNRVP